MGCLKVVPCAAATGHNYADTCKINGMEELIREHAGALGRITRASTGGRGLSVNYVLLAGFSIGLIYAIMPFELCIPIMSFFFFFFFFFWLPVGMLGEV